MIITPEIISYIVEDINSIPFIQKRNREIKLYRLYQGDFEDILLEEIKKEFKNPETIQGLGSRLIYVNIIKRIIDKLATVYSYGVVRREYNNDSFDQAKVNILENSMNLNMRLIEANRFLKLYKSALVEIYNKDKKVKARVLPNHTWKAYSFDATEPEKPNVIAKFIDIDSEDPNKRKIALWSDLSHMVIDGQGNILDGQLNNNPDNVNPFGTVPFLFVCSDSNSSQPIQDQTLYNGALQISKLITDTCHISKFSSFSVVYTIGVDGDIPFGPNNIIHLSRDEKTNVDPKIDTIKSEGDIDQQLSLIESLLAFILTTHSLSTNTISGKLDARNVASGIAKLIDESSSSENKKEQQAIFLRVEQELWEEKLAKHMIPYWIKNHELDGDLIEPLSDNFGVNITFNEDKPITTELERVNVIGQKLNIGAISRVHAIQELNPDLDKESAQQLASEIVMEKIQEFNIEKENLGADLPIFLGQQTPQTKPINVKP